MKNNIEVTILYKQVDKNKWTECDLQIPISITANQLFNILKGNLELEGTAQEFGFYCEETNIFFFGDEEAVDKKIQQGMILRIVSKETIEKNREKHILVDTDYPEFIRNARIQTVPSQTDLLVKQPMAKPTPNTNNLILSLLPSVSMLILTVVLRGILGGGSSFIIFSACSMSIGILTSIITFFYNGRKYKKMLRKRKETYEKYITECLSEIEQARKKERKDLQQIYCSAQKEYEMVMSFSSELFDRRPEHTDFLCICLGNAELLALRKISCNIPDKFEMDDALEEMPSKILETYQYIENVPLAFSLRECNAVGIVGQQEQLRFMFHRFVLDLCVRHFAKDVNIYIFVNDENRDLVTNIRLLPHLQNHTLNMRNLGVTKASRNILMDYLYKKLLNREQDREKTVENYDIIFMYDECDIKQHPLAGYIDSAKSIGACFIFFGKDADRLPQGCEKIVEVNKENGFLVDCKNKEQRQEFYYEKISDEAMEQVAKFLSPVHAKEVSLEGSIVSSVSLYEMFNIQNVDAFDVLGHWRESQPHKTLSAPLGIGRKGKLVSLDIHEKAHGPHGLVAGTTGSGKSELLQSYIISLAMNFPPNEVGFVLIDFKGGGMANQFKKLPHLIGTITNIDDRAIERSLKSIKAEILQRQAIFSKVGVNHIDGYIQKRKDNLQLRVIPHLIIIVDEFAELKAQQPEFMDELISASRIGRSLGVHLILATQKPAGQVSEQIWSNSTFKMCLKVQNENDSKEVLKSPLAAEIKEAGRCYLQVGNNEIFELFQSAYSGEKVREKVKDEKKKIELYQIGLSGEKIPVYMQKGEEKEEQNLKTQLEVVVEYLHDVVEAEHIETASQICLPELKEVIAYPNSQFVSENPSMLEVDLGYLDDPINQLQRNYTLEIAGNNLMIIGSAQSGKTNTLLTIIRSLSEKYNPSEVNFYVLDFGTMLLSAFEGLPHCGGVAGANDDEKVKNLFKLLFTEMEIRKEKLQSVGVGSLSAYREAGFTDIPYIVLMIDNFTALKEIYLEDDTDILQLSRDGLAVGISLIVTNAQTNGISYRMMSNFANKISLYCNDASEYNSLFGKTQHALPNVPGRCLLEVEKEILECQVYQAFEGEKEIERKNIMISYVNDKKAATSERAKKIPCIPKRVSQGYLEENYGKVHKPYQLCIGVNYENVEPVMWDLNRMPPLPVVGGEEGRQKEFFRSVCEQLRFYEETSPIEITVLDGLMKDYIEMKEKGLCEHYISSEEEIIDFMKKIDEEMEERYHVFVDDREKLDDLPFLLIAVTDPEVIESMSDKNDIVDIYTRITGKYNMLKIAMMFLEVPNQKITFGSCEILKRIKDAEWYLVFENVNSSKIVDFSLATCRKYKKKLECDDAYLTKEEEVTKLKTVWNEKGE